MGRQLGRVARVARLPADVPLGDGHRRHGSGAGHLARRYGRRRARSGCPAGRPADHGAARPGGACRGSRCRHTRVDHVRPQAEPRGARGRDRRRRGGRPDPARPGKRAEHVRGVRPGPGHRHRDRRRGAHRSRSRQPRRGQPHPRPRSRRRARRRDGLGRGRAGRRAGDPGLLPARQRHLRDLGMEGGAAADRDRRRARPPGRPRPPSQAGVVAVPAVPGRRGDPRTGKRGQRRSVPGHVQAPHRPGRDSPGHP